MFFFIIFGLFSSFLISCFFSEFLGLFGIFVVVNIFFVISLLFLFYNYFLMMKFLSVFFITFNTFLININYFFIEWTFLIDSLTLIMLVIITSISYLVYIYSFSYMRYDSQLIRFLFLLNLFSFFMILLVTAGNFIQLFIAWEGVGLCSYLLINFWFTRLLANKASLKAMLVNRIGDVCLLISFGFIYYIFYSFDFLVIQALVDIYKYVYFYIFGYYIHAYTLIGLFLLLGAFGKSAQLGFHTWLPDAMEGPTPVSALIHAATMVTAGIFLVIRTFWFFNYSYVCLFLLIFFGSFTALFGSIVAFFQYDIKKIIAYSTCSQLGYMFVACGLMKYDLSLFHLFNHAFFKALLFLGSGVLIHGLSDEQDLRRMGFLVKFFPFIYVSFCIGSYSLSGLPFMSGFYSKDLILETSLSYFNFYYIYVYLILVIAAFFTNLYSLKLIYLVFFNTLKLFFINYKQLVFESLFMIFSLSVLNILSIYSGFFFSDIFVGFGSNFFFFSFRNIIVNNNIYYNYEYLFSILKLIPFFFFFLSFFVYYLYVRVKTKYLIYTVNYLSAFFFFFKIIFYFFNKKMYFDLLYNNYLILNLMNFSYFIVYKKLDKKLFEILGGKGLNFIFFKFSNFFNLFFSNSFNNYIFILIFGFFFFFFFSKKIILFGFFYLFFFSFTLKKINFSKLK